MKILKFTVRFLTIVCLVIALSATNGCKNAMNDNMYYIDTTSLMTGYFEKSSDFQEFYKVLNKVEIASILNVYGSFTCYAPTDSAFHQFYRKMNVSGLDELDVAVLKRIALNHITRNINSTNEIREGALTDSTLAGDYLTASYQTDELGQSDLYLNGAKVIKKNILVNNGIIHAINKVIEPETNLVGQKLELDPKLTIFTEALKRCGLFDKLNSRDTVIDGLRSRLFYTVFAEEDSIFKLAGINSYEDLYNYTHRNNPLITDPTDPKDSLYIFIGYHVSPSGSFYTSKLTSIGIFSTFISEALIGITAPRGEIRLNADSIEDPNNAAKKILSPYQTINIARSNVYTKNGYVHKLNQVMPFYKIPQKRYLFEPNREVPYLQTNTGQIGLGNGITGFDWPELQWENIAFVQNWVGIAYGLNSDVFAAGSGLGTIWMTVPAKITPGKYKVWVGFRGANAGRCKFQTYLDEKALGTVVDCRMSLADYYGSAYTTYNKDAPGLLKKGVRSYIPGNVTSVSYEKYLGNVEFKKTEKHVIKLKKIFDGSLQIDVFEFEPIIE